VGERARERGLKNPPLPCPPLQKNTGGEGNIVFVVCNALLKNHKSRRTIYLKIKQKLCHLCIEARSG